MIVKYKNKYLKIINSILNMIEKYKNKHLKEVAYIIASGKSGSKFKPREPGVYIGVNNSYLYKNFFDKLSYIITENTSEIKSTNYEILDRIHDGLTIFTTFPVSQYKKSNIIELSYTDQQQLRVGVFDGASSITFYCFLFALYCGFSKIYLVGCDCTYDYKVYSPYSGDINHYQGLIRGWLYIKKYLIPNNVEVIILNPVNLTIFPCIIQEDDHYSDINIPQT
jgi:hypothetical protein